MEKIIVKNATKEIRKKIILDNINYTFENGKIYGLSGRNGCGKTMLLRALAGLIFLNEGNISYDGQVIHKDIDFPESIGIVIENVDLLGQFDGFTNLKLLAEIKNIITDEEIIDILNRIGLDAGNKKKVKHYSLGMRQKLAIAQAIMENPEVLLLDEPTNGLDEDGVLKIRELLLEMKDRGCIIILASHNKEDLGILADEIIYMNHGKILEK
ncbi:MAG: ATP-binding cassette domain-containing protein [Anaerostipes sp.]|nr:ATP-binding cassette domain-containing protein [Anaerostipes sp.]